MSIELSSVLSSLLSRNFSLAGDGDEKALQSNLQTSWRLIVAVGNGSDVQVEISVTNMASSYTVKSCVSRGSAADFTGFGAVEIVVKNTTAIPVDISLSLDRQPTERPTYQFCSERVSITNVAWTDIPSDTSNGYAPNFCRYVRIFATGNVNLRFLDAAGATVGLINGLTPQDVLLNELHVPPFGKGQIQSVAANEDIMSTWF